MNSKAPNLSLFLFIGPHRYSLNKPFVCNKYCYYTDGRIIVREPATEADNDWKFPDVEALGLLSCFNKCDDVKPWPRRHWHTMKNNVETNCPMCNGHGRIGKGIRFCKCCDGGGCGRCKNTGYAGGKRACGYCSRTGRVTVTPSTQTIGFRIISGWYDNLIRSLGEVTYLEDLNTAKNQGKGICFIAECSANNTTYHGMIMPKVTN